MNRVPCKICGAEILSATAERNQGLCARCSKGHRPCIYCGKYVSEPLRGGVFAHMECSQKNREEKESLGWRTVEDIDWSAVRQLLHGMMQKLFQSVGQQRPKANPVTLLFYIHVEDFVEIVVYEVAPDGSSKRLSRFEEDLSSLDSSFSLLCETLPEQDSIDASARMTESLTGIISDECNELAKANFYFPNEIRVSWSIKTA